MRPLSKVRINNKTRLHVSWVEKEMDYDNKHNWGGLNFGIQRYYKALAEKDILLSKDEPR